MTAIVTNTVIVSKSSDTLLYTVVHISSFCCLGHLITVYFRINSCTKTVAGKSCEVIVQQNYVLLRQILTFCLLS